MIAPVPRTFFVIVSLLVLEGHFSYASDQIDGSEHREERREFGRMISDEDESSFEMSEQRVLRELETLAMAVMSMSMSMDMMATEASSRKTERHSR